MPVLQLICNTSGTLKICPNLVAIPLPVYIETDIHFDYGIQILNVFMTFIYRKHHGSFDCGLELNLIENMFVFYKAQSLYKSKQDGNKQ